MKKLILLLLFPLALQAQALVEKTPPDYIKTIIFKADANDKNQFPIVRRNESFSLQFDDLGGNEETYYYKITHCNADWSASSLLKSEYLKGIDNQPLQPESNSYGTLLQGYSHYRLTFPNELTKITLSGNYMLSITDSYGTELFSRRFVLYTPQVNVLTEVKRARDLQYFDTQQVVQFTIRQKDFRLDNPNVAVKVAILQNYRWDTAITGVKPQYVMGNDLVYRYDRETAFWGGNEYFYFDSKDIRVPASGISRIDRSKWVNSYLFPNVSRASNVYTYYPDINGDFLVSTLNGMNPSNEADYTQVHFALEGKSLFGIKKCMYMASSVTTNSAMSTNSLMTKKTDFSKEKYFLNKGFTTISLPPNQATQLILMR